MDSPSPRSFPLLTTTDSTNARPTTSTAAHASSGSQPAMEDLRQVDCRRSSSGSRRGGQATVWWTAAAAAALALGSTVGVANAWAFLPAQHGQQQGHPPSPSLHSRGVAHVRVAGGGGWTLPKAGAGAGAGGSARMRAMTGSGRCSSSSSSSRLYAVDVDESKTEGEAAPAAPAPAPAVQTESRPLSEGERLQLKSQMLKLQAEKLRLEAEKEQIKMEREALLKKQKKQQDTDRLVEKFRAAQSSPAGMASPEAAAVELKAVVKTYIRNIDADSLARIRELSSEADTPEQALAYKNLADAVLKALNELDARQAKEIREELAFRFKDETPAPAPSNAPFDQFSEVEAAMRNASGTSSIDQLTQEMMRNNSRGFSTIYAINLPQWLPREFMRTLESFEPLLDEDVRTLRTEVFKMDTFFVTDVDKTPLAVAYMGTLRKPSEEVFKDVEKRLQELEGGLKDRVQLFLFENPRPQMQEMGGMMGGGGDAENPEVMFMAVSTRVKPLPVGGGQVTLSLLSLGATALNCLVYSILTFYSPADIVNKLGEAPLARLDDALPVAVGILGIQLAHDLAHNLAAKAKDVKLGVPVYIPSLQVGTFGSVLRFVSFPKSRKDMFDVAIAGPLTGLALSLAAFAAGMAMTNGAPVEISEQWPMLPVALFRSSLMLWQVGQALFSADVVNLPLTNQIHVHPLAIIGALGLLTQALQAMPIGRLDGGRATTSVFGRKAATFLSASLVLYQVVSGVVLGNTLQLFWGTVVIIFQNAQEMYARDEISPVDDNRRNLLLLLWVVAAVVLLPGVPWRDAGVFDDFGGFMT